MIDIGPSARQAAKDKGYSKDLCEFLGRLEDAGRLRWPARGIVTDAIGEQAGEDTVIRLALAFSRGGGIAFPDIIPGVYPDDKATYDDVSGAWERYGDKFYMEHCTPDGRFRYEDFRQ